MPPERSAYTVRIGSLDLVRNAQLSRRSLIEQGARIQGARTIIGVDLIKYRRELTPHCGVAETMTWSPTLTRLTAVPTSMTTPTPPWPV
jgi:hypothetical protein